MTRIGKAPPDCPREYEAIYRTDFPLVQLGRLFAPRVIGHERAKRALCIVLASMDDMHGSRGRVSALLHGPAGGAKTTLIEYAAAVANTEVYSPTLTPGSLTIDFRDRKTGAFSQVHDQEFQLFALDETDKLDRKLYKHFLRAMEQGRIAVPSKSGAGDEEDGTGPVDEATVIPAHIRVIATANNIELLPGPFLDRFDYQMLVKPPKANEAKLVVEGISKSFMAEDRSQLGPSDDPAYLRGYFRWVRKYTPTFDPEERKYAIMVLAHVLRTEAGLPLRLRQYEAVFRTAYALARIRHEPVTVERVMDAVECVFYHRDWDGTFSRLKDVLGILRRKPGEKPIGLQAKTPLA